MNNKENVSANKFEGPILRMEPLQMKKKKKGGGYNLRKSIAWNRAFYTEEGVLDSEELSLISGAEVSSSREVMSTVTEEALDSFVEDDHLLSDSATLQELEKNLFRGAPITCSQENREIAYLPPKHTSPARSSASTSMASHKALLTPGAKRAGSVSGAPLGPSPSSSYPSNQFVETLDLKRPANINAGKRVAEESKLPKVSKQRHLSLLGTSKINMSGTASSIKSQILRPGCVANKQRNVEPKSNGKCVNIPKCKAKDIPESLSVKSSALRSKTKRNKVNPPLPMLASAQLRPPLVTEVGISGRVVIQEDDPRTIKMDVSKDQDATAQLGDSRTLNNIITGRTLQHTKILPNKPSGLRMPSPSLGFFDQSKASASNRFTRSVVHPYPRVEKLGDKSSSVKVLQVLNSNVPSANSLVSSLRCDLKTLSNSSITRDAGKYAGENGKKIMYKCDKYVVESDVENIMCVSSSEEKIQHHAKNGANITLEEDRGVRMNDCKMVLVNEPRKDLLEDRNVNNYILDERTSRESTGSKDFQFLSLNSAQYAIDVAGTRSIVENPRQQQNSSNFAATEPDVAVEFQSGDMDNSKVLSSAALISNCLSCESDLHQPSLCLSDDLETYTGEKHVVGDVCNPSREEEKPEKLNGYSQSCAGEIIGNKIFSTVVPNQFELEDSSFSSECMGASQLEDSFVKGDMTNSQGQETLSQIPNLTLVASLSESCLDQSSETGDLFNPSVTLLGLQTTCLRVENDSKNIHELASADCWLLDKDACSEDIQKYVIETSPLVLSDKRGKSEVDSSSGLISDELHGVNGEGYHTYKITSLDHAELDSVQAACPAVNQECLLQINANSVANLRDEPSSLDFLSCSSELPEIDNKALTILEPARQDLFDASYRENQVADTSQTSLSLESKVCDEDQICHLQSFAETDPTFHAGQLVELERHCRLPQVVNVMERGNMPMESVNEVNFSETVDDSGQCTGGYEPVLTISHTSITCNHYVEGANSTVQPGQPELPICSILARELPEDKKTLLPGNCSNEERDEVENSKESIASVTGAHTVPHEREPCESELNSCKVIGNATQRPLPTQSKPDDGNESNEGPCIEDLRSSSIETRPSSANKLFGGSQLRHGPQFGGDLTFPEGKNQSVGLLDGAFVDETQPKDFENRDTLVEDTKCDSVTLCQENGEKATAQIEESTVTSNGRNLTIFPPRNAVPFSDEWLAAIEAAGEEILTLKSGVVQNSPPDKSLPEPSPWSPVKKKNNAIGPYDCTKFTNI